MQFQFKTTIEKVDNALRMIQQNGGRVSYKDHEFSIKGVEGEWVFEDGTLTVLITDKPWLASWGMIESKLKEFFV